jgi:membrane-associated phospholipid phosphatase
MFTNNIVNSFLFENRKMKEKMPKSNNNLSTNNYHNLRLFFSDWLPFIVLFISYEMLRGFVPYIIHNVHIFPMIKIDLRLFGFIPTIYLQNLLYTPHFLHWYDYLSVLLYIMQDITPLIIGYIFWKSDRYYFKQFSRALLLLSYLAFFTYITFPAMPPWMASNYGYLPSVKDIMNYVMAQFQLTQISFPSAYSIFGSDPVAAIPSLHVAFPSLMLLFIVKKFGTLGFTFLPYLLGVIFSVLYLGQHYFIDIVLGGLYAFFVFILFNKDSFFKIKKADSLSSQTTRL